MKDDVIYRQAAIDALAEECYHDVEDYRTAVRVVGNLPSAQPDLDSAYQEGYTAAEAKYRAIIDDMKAVRSERENGHWTVKNGELAFWDVCSICKKMIIHRMPYYNFCPNCGADMRGTEND